MLEIRDLTKVYTTKGVSVRALDGVSLRFPEKGMVFLLGKSGSGKSTLLNLCGGLDAPDSGEIVIKGRSSKDFTQSDFDSYRNTFIGFVFQEYNILNEFSVEDNIALALELQGKSKDRARVQEILRQVDLEQFARRKPNTLSGGQKQRVAIARALVKNPEIIMADEPTGALDSKTGKQVFDTLKKLSGSKLVIVVSHDREFAEVYGDRIIELKDGKVISDVTKEKIAAVRESDNLTFIGEDTISVQDGSRLTDADMGRIRAFLAKVKGRVLLTGGEKEIADFKKAARIDDSGARETFAETNEAAIPAGSYTEADSRFIRSKLPVRHAVRIGASSMKVKPFRLFFTILLSFIAFTMFGLFSTLTFYDEKDVTLQTYLDAGYSSVALTRSQRYTTVRYNDGEEYSRYERSNLVRFTKEQLSAVAETYGPAVGAYNFTNAPDAYSFPSLPVSNVTPSLTAGSAYYANSVAWFAEAGADTQGISLLTGTDLSSLGENDVVISSYLFDGLQASGITDREGDAVSLQSYEDIIGKEISLPSVMNEPVWLTVRGVFRSDIPQKYASLTPETMTDDTLTAMFQQDIAYSLCSAVLVSEDFYDAHADQFRREWSDTEELGRYLDTPLYVELSSQDVEEAMSVMQIAGYGETEKAALPYVLWTDGAKQTLADDEILLSTRDFLNTLDNIFRSYADRNTDEYRQAYDAALDEYVALHRNDADALQFYRQQYEEYLAQYLEWDYTQEEAESSAAESAENDLRYYLFEVGGYDYAEQKADDEVSGVDGLQTVLDLFWQAGQGGTFSDAEMDRIISALTPMLERAAADGLIDTSVPVRTEGGSSLGTFRVAGFIFPGDIYVDALFSQSTFDTLAEEYGNPYYSVTETNYIPAEGEKYNAVFLLSPDRTALSAVVEELGRYGEDDTNVRLLSSLSSPLDNVNQMIDMLSQVFLWVGVVMAVFSMLLLFNFISVSITNKKREIGILRAVGARSADVFRIFFSESAIISAVCFVLSVIASIVVCGVLNNVLAADLGASIFVFGPLSVLALLGIAVVTSFIATFLPVYGIARKKPVESIRAL